MIKVVLMSYSSINYALKMNKYYDGKVQFIVFNNEQIIKFLIFAGVKEENIKFYSYYISGYNLISNYKRYKTIFYQISKIKNSTIYIFNKNECVEIFDLFYRIRKNNKIKFINFDNDFEYKSKVNYMVKLKNYIFFKPFIRIGYNLVNNGVYIETDVNKKSIDLFSSDRKDYKNIEIDNLNKISNADIICAEVDLAIIGRCESEEFIRVSSKIFNIISKENTVIIKPHPSFKKLYYNTEKKNVKVVEDFIPLEMMITLEKKQIVIGVMSSALINASKNSKTLVISTLELFEINEKDSIKKWLNNESNNKIKFVQSIEDLEGIIKSYNQLYND